MKMKFILIGILCMIMFAENVAAENPYGKIYTYDVYYNDRLLPGTDVAKPVLKIGEPFNVGINLTVYQKSEVSIELSEIDKGYFIIVDGPTSKMNVYRSDVLEKNMSMLYRWTLTPTEKWAGGSLPLDLVYQIDDFKTKKSLVHSSFTIAYPYISNQHYKAEASTPKDQNVPETENTPTTKPASMPDFNIITGIAAIALMFFGFFRK